MYDYNLNVRTSGQLGQVTVDVQSVVTAAVGVTHLLAQHPGGAFTLGKT